jgi:ectoine hydroxylase-related dioxygenase (phytanoyl-CoA dioxygenase family)
MPISQKWEVNMSRLDHAGVQQFHEQGYLVIADLLDPERDIQPLLDEYADRLDDLVTQWHSEGKLTSAYQELPFEERITRVLHKMGEHTIHYFEITLPFAKITRDTPIHVGPAVFNLLRSPRVLDAVESIIGPEIYCAPVQHIRIKIPEAALTDGISELAGRAPVHQDMSGTLPQADNSDMITVWAAITDATEENGCLVVWPGSHLNGLWEHVRVIKQGKHHGTIIPEHLYKDKQSVRLPVKRGSVILLHPLIPHGSPANKGEKGIRFSMDFRYHPVGQPTPRPMFPGFVARSRRNPESELRNSQAWANLWMQRQEELSGREMPVFHRWKGDSVQVIE